MPPENHDKLPKAFKFSSNNEVAGKGQNQSDNQNDILVKYHYIMTNTVHIDFREMEEVPGYYCYLGLFYLYKQR